MHQQPHQTKRFTSPLSKEEARKQAYLLKALADPYRLQIIDLLHCHRGMMNVLGIVETLGSIAQPTVSHHLRILRDAGIIDYRKEGLYAYYYVQHAALTEAYRAIYRERQEKSA